MKPLLAIAGIAALMLSGPLVDTADAQKRGWTTKVTNPGGNQPPGQQGNTRTTGGWSTTVTNPGGNQPPGQQPR